MNATGFKTRKAYECPSQASSLRIPAEKHSNGTAVLEREEDCPPRLCRRDLKDPERFHERLVQWLMKQR